ncbi:MAG: helix-turn-helix domain-containing protein [Desulfobacterales bacterium]|nr:helix-turn-helix domain-containing protein [Desulfobacterales bacterium]
MRNIKKNVLDFEILLSRIKTILNTESDKAVAIAINMKPNAFYNRKKKNSVPLSEFVYLANTHNVSTDWLINGEGPIYKGTTQESNHQSATSEKKDIIVSDHQAPEEKIIKDENGINIPQWNNPDPDMYHYIPMAEATLNAGGGTFVLSEKTTGRYYAFRKNFLSFIASSPKNLILMKVTGDSMEPKIEDGDTVMIDIGKRQLKNGAIYALGYDDVVVIKEVEKLPGGKVLVISKNQKIHPPYEADIQNIRIIGQVIWGDRTFVK